jgi:hypothetical protein
MITRTAEWGYSRQLLFKRETPSPGSEWPGTSHHLRRFGKFTQRTIGREYWSLHALWEMRLIRCTFKLTCTIYGYTVLGKGTTAGLWKEVSREAQVHQILRKAQGSAVPVSLGTIDLAKPYFLHGPGEIRHLFVMGWGNKVHRPWNWSRRFCKKFAGQIRKYKPWESFMTTFVLRTFFEMKRSGGRWLSTYTALCWKKSANFKKISSSKETVMPGNVRRCKAKTRSVRWLFAKFSWEKSF